MNKTKITRGITIPSASLEDKLKVICCIKFEPIPAAELAVLSAIITYSQNNGLFISPDISRQIRQFYGLSESSFNTALFRLVKKGLIKKEGKTVVLPPIFFGIIEMDNLLISFVG